MEASQDLRAWQRVGEGVVASLEHRGQQLRRTTVPLRQVGPASYLRVTAAEGRLPDITAVSGLGSRRTAQPPRVTVTANATLRPDGVLQYDLGGPFPVAAVGCDLPERNTLVHGTRRSSALPITRIAPSMRLF